MRFAPTFSRLPCTRSNHEAIWPNEEDVLNGLQHHVTAKPKSLLVIIVDYELFATLVDKVTENAEN